MPLHLCSWEYFEEEGGREGRDKRREGRKGKKQRVERKGIP